MKDVHIIVTEKEDKLMFHFPRDVISFKERENIRDFDLDMTAYSKCFENEDVIGAVDAEIKMFIVRGTLELHFPKKILFPREKLFKSIKDGIGGMVELTNILMKHKIKLVDNSSEFDKDNS